MSTYMVVTYIAFFVFIATILILNTTFLPKMVEAGTQLGDDDQITVSPTTIQTDLIPTVQLIFVAAVVIHAFGDGILAGVIQDGKIENGMRHSFIMLLVGVVLTSLL